MNRIFNFKSFVLNERHAQLTLFGKTVYEDVEDAFEDNQVMRPKQYTTEMSDVDDLVEAATPAAMKVLQDSVEFSIIDYIYDFIYKNAEDDNWVPNFWKEHDVDITDNFDYDKITDLFVNEIDINDALTDEGKEAWTEYFTNTFNDEIQDMLWTVGQSMDKNDGLIDVWRSIQFSKEDYDDVYNAITKGHHGGVGIYWSWEEDTANAYGGRGGTEIMLHGQVRPEDIEWEDTLMKTVYYLKHEKELEMKDTSAIKLVGMSIYKGSKRIGSKRIYKEFETPYVVKMGSVYKA